MGENFSRILSTGYMGTLELDNRIVMAPVGTGNASEEGHVTATNIRYYQDIAEGGTGLIIVESTYVDNIASKGEDGQLSTADNARTNGLAVLASAIHDNYGVKCAIQLTHEGQQVYLVDRLASWGPSEIDINWNGIPMHFHGMSVEEIKQLEQDFAAAAWRAKIAGFDAVEIHSSGGHLHNMFLSPNFNKREDDYGGSIENRMRFLLETIEAVRMRVGKDFPIIVRFCGDDLDEGGLHLDESIEMARMLDEAGIAAINLNGGSLSNGELTPTCYTPRATHVYMAEAYKKAGIQTPIIITGSITTPDVAEEILESGKADFIGLARPLLADPNWVKKLKAGAPEDIRPCIRCGLGCVGTLEEVTGSRGLRCSVNPLCNLGLYRSIKPLAKKKNVAIVGGGPAGMEAARIAKLRGHDVTIYEKRKLGGTMHEASFDPELKGDIKLLIAYYLKQMEKMGIPVKYEKATAASLLEEDYDAVVVATGAKSRKLHLPGLDKPIVCTDLKFTAGEAGEMGDTVIIVGGGVVAAEIAVSLAKQGRHIILTTRRGAQMGPFEVASDGASASWQKLLALLMMNQVDIRICQTLQEVTDKGVIVADPTGATTEIEGDNVILCAGYEADNVIARQLKSRMSEVYVIGDAVKAREIGDAVHEGWLVGNQL